MLVSAQRLRLILCILLICLVFRQHANPAFILPRESDVEQDTKRASRTPERGGNRLLDRLPTRQRRAVLGRCDTVDLKVGTILCQAGEPFDYMYFPISGSISLVTSLVDHKPFETENVGREGMLGVGLMMAGNRALQRGVVQAPGVALRIKRKMVQKALSDSPALLHILQRYSQIVIAELSQTIGCVRFHSVKGQLARRLLLAHDRVRPDELPLLTHQSLGDMLGVQRGSITISAASLQRNGIIRYSRGSIAILDRERLEAAACSCYQTSLEKYTDLLT